jgi:predicted GTPase/uncharacterized protein (DUF697 family)
MWHPFKSYFEDVDGDPEETFENGVVSQASKPVVWMLGKTGAGKSSLVRSLTGMSSAEVGNGFEPCTRTATFFDFPPDMPVMRFLDTRGLGEAGYDPTDDLIECEGHSHAILAVARLDDPVQGELAEAIAAVIQRKPSTQVIIVHTAADLVEGDQERARAQAANQKMIDAAVSAETPSVVVSLGVAGEDQVGIDDLLDMLRKTMPDVATLLMKDDLSDAESRRFAEIRTWVITYASAAAATDVMPLVGIVGVPASQAAMLRMLAQHYKVRWTREVMSGFFVALGAGAAARFGASFGLRQVSKLIPVYGQSVGAAAASAISFSATYALGRSAAYFLDRMQRGDPVDKDQLRAVYNSAFDGVRRGSE